ncbi:DUF6268 family outer membrane beta-barrel protein [Flagellimonas sp. S174]|uniref:DUF6268 family outer membrane beta-barrel protein n=1 Tax=Flagellimonas sp. S174 TaxID=3410790 RepID=UPI003BF53DD2
MKKWMLLVGMMTIGSLQAQLPIFIGNSNEPEPISINYGLLPDLGGTEIQNYGLNLSFAKPIKKGVLGARLGYQLFSFDFNSSTNLVSLSTFEDMHSINTGVFYLRPLKNNWRMVVSVGTTLTSNFGDGISEEDFVFNAILGFTKRWGEGNRFSNLLVGAFYGTQFGEPIVFPAVSFSQQLNEHWSYSLGIPVTGLTYRVNAKHSVAILASPQGIFGNNSNEIAVEGNATLKNTKLQFNGINTRFSYRYLFTKNLAFVGEVGFVPNPTLQILDDENKEIFDFEPESGAYFNLGLRFVLQIPKQNNSK